MCTWFYQKVLTIEFKLLYLAPSKTIIDAIYRNPIFMNFTLNLFDKILYILFL